MYRKSIIIILFIFLALSSCKSKYEDCYESDYQNCNTSKPETGSAEIELSYNGRNRIINVRMFEGNFEDGNLIWEEDMTKPLVTKRLDVDKYYSFTATYYVGGDTIVAVDGGEIKVRQYTMCEYTCYETREFIIDLKID